MVCSLSVTDLDFRLPRGVVLARGDGDRVFEPRVGFRVSPVEGRPFTGIIDAICSADKLRATFSAIADLILPASVYFILESYVRTEGPDLYLSAFHPREQVEATLASSIEMLLEDGMLAFGMAWSDSGRLEEVFIDDHKSLKDLYVDGSWSA